MKYPGMCSMHPPLPNQCTCLLVQITQNMIVSAPFGNKLPLVNITDWHWLGDIPLSDQKLIILLIVCITQTSYFSLMLSRHWNGGILIQENKRETEPHHGQYAKYIRINKRLRIRYWHITMEYVWINRNGNWVRHRSNALTSHSMLFVTQVWQLTSICIRPTYCFTQKLPFSAKHC